MKSDITHGYSSPQRHTEGLNRAVQVLVMNHVLVMPHPSGGICDLIAYETNAIDIFSGLDLVDRCSSPGHEGRLLLHCGANSRKGETSRAADIKTTVGDVIVLVALARMGLAPGIFMWSDVLTFGKISRARILSWVQITYIYRHSV